MKKTLFLIILFATTGILTSAQNKENYSYRDLISQQKIERDELKQTQKEILDRIIERQKEEMKEVSGNTGPVQTMQEKHRAERESLMKILAEERENQLRLQSEERKQFPLKPQ